ncbi:G patch domain-containing protein 11 [Adelges cooleyi]|uniref:G patch domain-containing protein 11 n=1 Tax=Adelges cooleyi TaxID=133065 RepID=UPI00217F5A69|nr:G patch domain-containing protein 11 [Adelges cooleyi]
MTEEEEDDYMSDAFLNVESTRDVRPGLLMTHKDKRLHHQMKKKELCEIANKGNTVKLLEEKNRQEGLEKAIDSSNKGFSLLQKMGYKPGSGIGKNNCGRVDPIGIVLKTDRKGLGRDEALREIREMKKKMILKRLSIASSMSVTEYRERRAQVEAEKQDRSDLYRCQRICRQMDLEKDIQEPSETFLWPEVTDDTDKDDIAAEDTEVVEENMSIAEQLEIVKYYLRKTYKYCVYCGTVYDNEEDLDNECPGPSRQDH